MISSSIQTAQKQHFCERCIIHSCIPIRGYALFSLRNSLHHGRHEMVENKGSNVGYDKINISFPDWVKVKVENIIPRNMIILFLGMIFSTITQSRIVIYT